MSLDISFFLLIILLLFFVLVILFCSFDKRVTNFVDHAVGRKKFATATIVATIVACNCPGGILRNGIQHASNGSWFWVDKMVITLSPLLLLSWLSGRMSKFIYHLSMPETMHSVYGSYARLITALFEVCSAIIVVSFQIRVISDTIRSFLLLASPLAITILITIVMVGYAMFGGVRAIALTDVWQCIIFSTLMVVLSCCLFKKTDKPIIEIIDFLKDQKKFGWNNIIPSDRKIPTILRYLSDMSTAIAPYLVHYVYMSKSLAQARKVCLYGAIFSSAIMACTLVIGLLIFVCFPHVPSTAIWNHFLANASFPLKVIVAVVMLSFAISTVDSRLHVASIMLAYDIPKSIGCFRRLFDFHQIQLARAALCAVAVITMVLAFYFSTSILIRILVWHGRLYASIVVAPFILAILGFRSSPSVALIGMSTGLLSMLAWQKSIAPMLHTTSGHVPCMLMNGLVMIVLHYLLHRIRNKQEKPFDTVKSIQQANGV